MKKLFLAIIFVLFLVGPAQAFMPPEFAVQSGTTNVDSYVVTEGGFLYGIWVSGIVSGVTVCAYDVASGTTSGATTLFPETYLPLSGSVPYAIVSFDPPVPFNKGVAVDITGTGAVSYKVYYRYRRDQ